MASESAVPWDGLLLARAMQLAAFKTADLEAELQRRREVAAQAAEAERKAREVVVVCPRCDGRTNGWRCQTCGGCGRITALLAK